MNNIIGIFGSLLSAGWIGYELRSSTEIPFEPLITFLASLGVWFWPLLSKSKSSNNDQLALHPHDVQLGNRIRNLFTVNYKQFLRDGGFLSVFRIEMTDPISDIAEWKGAEYEFENDILDNIAFEIVRLCDEIDSKLSIYSHPIANPNTTVLISSIASDRERATDMYSNDTERKRAEIKSLCKSLLDELEEFEKNFRKLSPESYKLH
ncbi:hypothetical protein AAIB41_02615 [Brucella sp. BE17]|uniref:hypothetical protein n=1 Tax=Brucella sp. BE17 TaxID=3142977 RepID=UPI0031BA994F